MPAPPALSAGRKTDPDSKGHLAFAQLPKLIKTPRPPALPVGGGDAAPGEGDDSDSAGYSENDEDSDALVVEP